MVYQPMNDSRILMSVLMKALRKNGYFIGRYKTRTIMRKLGLVVRQRVAYEINFKLIR